MSEGDFDADQWQSFSDRIQYVELDATAHDAWGDLAQQLEGKDDRTRVAYLATAPSLFGTIAKGLQANGLITATEQDRFGETV